MAEQVFDVFLSYNKEERASVAAIAVYLRDVAGVSPWFDPWEAIPGMSVTDNLMQGLESSKTCAVFIGKSGEGPWQKSEIRKAIERQKQRHMLRVIPVLLPDAPEQLDTSSFLLEFTWVDFRGKALNDDHALWCLECGIRGVAPGRGRPMPLRNITIDLPGSVTLELVAIPAGTFYMGQTSEELKFLRQQNWWHDWFNNESPRHQVVIAPFYIGKYLTIQAQWQTVMENNPSKFKGAERPVERVSWNDAQKFLKKLNAMVPFVETHVRTFLQFRLPSEAEWEYVCRAGTNTAYSFGDDLELLGKYAWFNHNSNNETHSVGQKCPNKWQLYDIQGNVWEWCQDAYANYNDTPTDGSSYQDGSSRILRGGSWFNEARYMRSAFRFSLGPDFRSDRIGFRVAATLE